MNGYLTHPGPELSVIKLRAVGAGMLGDASVEIRPGESVFGRTFAEWRALPPGPVALPEPGEPDDPAA